MNDKQISKQVEINLSRMLSGKTNHVEKTEIRNASGKVIKTITTTTPSNLNLEDLLERTESKKKSKRAKR